MATTFHALNPATGASLEPEFRSSSLAEIEHACRAAALAAPEYGQRSGAERARFLREIAVQLETRREALVARAQLETGLTAARLQGETTRTANQLRLFAEVVEEGSWVDARLDRRIAAQEGVPERPDLRSMLRPMGPVAVFGASNFPLAFSVAGGDTASALAGGNPVIVKAHPAHPGTSRLAAEAIEAAVAECGWGAGVFAILYDAGIEVGLALVRHPAVRAVGFTGSLRGGRALMDAAAARPAPIPVFAEMGSSNPVFILPRAMADRGAEIARGLHASVTLGAGQFCTKPGLVMVAHGAPGDTMRGELQRAMAATPEAPMLTAGIAAAFRAGGAARGELRGVERMTNTGALLFETAAERLLESPELAEELFGPTTLVVRHTPAQLLELARSLEGHLTATVHGTDEDLRENAELLHVLAARVGRLVLNGFPTGVAVTHAMVHGGPYPASSSGETSVGTRAILRFVRPVCFQDAPEFALPPELQDANPLGIARRLDGRITRDPVRKVFRRRRTKPAGPPVSR
ncbi:MAG TPA: aldehyde dehydrogenase (NADP(+)) [Terriglobales bacterium]|nr:aldehyde dehydrogenase (NADP(+)) [Terriglobales bacterium]